MAPADTKDWLFAALALTSVSSTSAIASEGEKFGVFTGVSGATQTDVTQSGTSSTAIVLGDSVRGGQEYQTGPDGTAHILFNDQSSVTLAPNTRLQITTFTFDPETSSGKIVLSLDEGAVRVVGGKNSKTNSTDVKTKDATVSIRGGISTVQTMPSGVSATFLFGQSMQVQSNDAGNSQVVTRPGYTLSTTQGGGSLIRRESQRLL